LSFHNVRSWGVNDLVWRVSGMFRGAPPKLKWLVLGGVLGLSVLTAALLAYLNPDTSALVE
jgi:hypothetical protein